jgi:hypothetical protein
MEYYFYINQPTKNFDIRSLSNELVHHARALELKALAHMSRQTYIVSFKVDPNSGCPLFF